MKAMITTAYGSADVFQLKELPKPTAGPNELLIKIHASSVTKADTMMRTGKPYIGRLFTGISKPKMEVWGCGFAGTVEAVGSAVSKFKKGDKVFGENINQMGAYAEYIILQENGILAPLPQNLSFEEAAGMCDGAITSLNFLLNLGKIKKGDKVLINGASGSLGTAAVQIAKYYGADVSGVCSAKNAEMVKALGADKTIDYKEEDFTQHENTYDLIYDTVGKSSFSAAKKALTENGQYLSPVLGMPLMVDMIKTAVYGKKKAKFSATGALPLKETKRLMEIMREMIEEGKLYGVIDRCYDLEELSEAHQYVDRGHKKGNVVVLPTAA